jgi:hypothetical protein
MKRTLTNIGAMTPLSATVLLTLAATATGQRDGPSPLDRAWREALARIRADKAPGLVFVLPPADRPADRKSANRLRAVAGKLGGEVPVRLDTARDVLRMQIQALRATFRSDRDHARSTALFALAVTVVAEPATCRAEPGETIVLLGPDGERVQGFAVDVGDRAAVLAALEPLLLAREAVEARRGNLPPDLAARVARRGELCASSRRGGPPARPATTWPRCGSRSASSSSGCSPG